MKLSDYLDYHFNVSERVEAFKKGKQYSCEIELTNRCNFSCSYCYASANKSKVDLPKDLVISMMYDLQAYDIREIGWIGGEPLLYDGLLSMVTSAKVMGFSQALYTNASKLDGSLRRMLKSYIHRYIVHVDSVDYGEWAKGQLKPSKTNFDNMIMNVFELAGELDDPGRLIVSLPLTRSNYERLEQTLGWITSIGVKFINLIPLTPLGRSNDMEQFISQKEIWRAMLVRAEYLDLPELLGLGIGEYCKQFQLTDFTVNYKGDVLPYIDYFNPVGNVFDQNLLHILSSNSDALRLKDYVGDDSFSNIAPYCSVCKYGRYCFGNPVSRIEPSPMKPDPDCYMVEQCLSIS